MFIKVITIEEHMNKKEQVAITTKKSDVTFCTDAEVNPQVKNRGRKWRRKVTGNKNYRLLIIPYSLRNN